MSSKFHLKLKRTINRNHQQIRSDMYIVHRSVIPVCCSDNIVFDVLSLLTS